MSIYAYNAYPLCSFSTFCCRLFLSIACYLFVLGPNFIGLSYLLVYVGAVSTLFLFILMLINVRISELLGDASNTIPLALTIAVYFNYPIYDILPRHMSYTGFIWDLKVKDYLPVFELDESYKSYNYNNEIAFVSSGLWDGNLAEATHITSTGNIMLTSYSIWLIMTSVILLLAMVGAIVITIKQKN